MRKKTMKFVGYTYSAGEYKDGVFHETEEFNEFYDWFEENYEKAVEIYNKYIDDARDWSVRTGVISTMIKEAIKIIQPKLNKEINSKSDKYEFFVNPVDGKVMGRFKDNKEALMWVQEIKV